VVVLGPDHIGKSALLRALAMRGHDVVSYDDELLEPGYAMLALLRAAWWRGMAAGHAYSREFLLAGLQLPLVYLRDEMLRRRRRARVIVDSYYYKILAKCRLLGFDQPRITGAWREFPTPDLVLVLRASEEALWQRAGRGSGLNPFEYYGKEPTRAGYLAFQRDLMRAMLEDVAGIPAWELDGDADLDAVRRQAEELIGRMTSPTEQKQDLMEHAQVFR
jgi:thymidylate kinase